MEQLRAAVLAVCMLSAAVGLITLIRPGRVLERQVRFLVSLLFVVSLTAPFLHMEVPSSLGELQAREAQAHADAITAEMEAQMLAQTQMLAADALQELLAAQGITCEEITVQAHIGENGSIYLSEVSVRCDDFAGASGVLTDALGEEVSIRVTEVLSEAEEE